MPKLAANPKSIDIMTSAYFLFCCKDWCQPAASLMRLTTLFTTCYRLFMLLCFSGWLNHNGLVLPVVAGFRSALSYSVPIYIPSQSLYVQGQPYHRLSASPSRSAFFTKGTGSFPMTATTRRTTRQSARSASRTTTTLEGAKESQNETVTPLKKVIKPRKSKAKKILTNVTPAENTSVSTTPADSHGHPWYLFFTKGDKEYNHYMATEWGFEKRGMIPLFEKMSLEGAQSGLSWLTVLRKREAYRRVFHGFNVDKVAAMTPEDVDKILAEEDKANPRNIVVRHRGKIESVINNAQCIQKLLQDHPNKPDYWDEFLWSFVDDRPILNRSWNGSGLSNAMTQSKESTAMSKALKALGFRFVGPTTMYAMMQSCGMVIDHPVDSPEWHAALKRLEQRPGGFQDQSLG